uniref:Uncharacterized protein n=1 Tax=Anguilla anguilla TaxID=7936 RepID=A0A0E9SKE4_ANGAN
MAAQTEEDKRASCHLLAMRLNSSAARNLFFPSSRDKPQDLAKVQYSTHQCEIPANQRA